MKSWLVIILLYPRDPSRVRRYLLCTLNLSRLFSDALMSHIMSMPMIPNCMWVMIPRFLAIFNSGGQCIPEIKVWMLYNKLRLNDTKTEFFLIFSPRQLNLVAGIKLKISGSEIDPSGTIKNLGVTFDPYIKMDFQVNSLCRTVNFHLRNIARSICRFIGSRSMCTCSEIFGPFQAGQR